MFFSFHCYITLYSYTFDFGCEITIQVCQMVTEHQEKSIKRIDYCYSFYFSNIFRPFSVSIYFCFGCFGLSGYFMETNPSSNAGVKYLYKKFTLSFNIKKDMISLTEYSPSFNIPTSSNTCWVLVGYLLDCYLPTVG